MKLKTLNLIIVILQGGNFNMSKEYKIDTFFIDHSFINIHMKPIEYDELMKIKD